MPMMHAPDQPPHHKSDTFDPLFFAKLEKAEKRHFWFRVRRSWIRDSIRRFVPSGAHMLEVGCGSGNVSSYLASEGYKVTGCDLYAESLERAWPGFVKVCGDTSHLPFRSNTFDVVGFFDVIEHFEDDTAPLREAMRLLRDGGVIAITVPARSELWSYTDEVSLHRRRYDKGTIRSIFSDLGMKLLSTEYMFMSLYLPMMLLRREGKRGKNAFNMHHLPSSLLTGLFHIERTVAKVFPLPVGTSLIAIAKK